MFRPAPVPIYNVCEGAGKRGAVSGAGTPVAKGTAGSEVLKVQGRHALPYGPLGLAPLQVISTGRTEKHNHAR